jgi:hypothetical protein
VDFDLLINGTRLGRFTVLPGETYRSESFAFIPISGPTYTIRLEETNTVDPGMGSIVLPLDTSQIRLSLTTLAENVALFKNTLDWMTTSSPSVPDIDVSPTSLGSVQPPDTTTVLPLTIRNLGTAVLDWAIFENNALPPLERDLSSGTPNDDPVVRSVETGGAIIDNGIVQLGIHDQGHLNIPGPASGGGVPYVGLRYLPTNAEATAPGCLCEGWGVADGITGETGYANETVDLGANNMSVLGFSATSSTASSTVQIGSTFEVTHLYQPSPATPYLYEVVVSITNISPSATEVLYRRVMDWDVEPTIFAEYVTIQGTAGAANVAFASDDGFASANPLAGPSSIQFTGDAVDDGPADHGALFDFNFGSLASGETLTFKTFYGAAGNETEALGALAAAGAHVYSLGQPSTADGPTLGTPNTFIFGFSGVGGAPLCSSSDIPWASVSPDTGTTAPGSGDTVSVTLDSTGLTTGVYHGNLCVQSNDPDEPIVVVPVSLEVEDTGPTANLWFDPNPAEVSVNGEVTVDVMISDVADLYGASLTIAFDQTLVEVVDMDGGASGVQIDPGSCPIPDFIVQNNANNSTGVINFDVSSLAPSPPCNGTGVVASITFRGLAEGNSPLVFTDWLLSDTNGFEIPATASSGEIVIIAMGAVDGYIQMQGRSAHNGAEVCAWESGSLVDCVLTDPTGYYSLSLLNGSYDIVVEMDRYLDSEKSGVVVVAGSTTTLATLTLPGGDANDDDVINILDLSFMGARYTCALGDGCFDPKADINDDDIINIQDIVLAGGNYLETSPVPWP